MCLDSLKSELEKLEEEAMINELVELVERRDQLLWALHLEKGRYVTSYPTVTASEPKSKPITVIYNAYVFKFIK